MSFTPIATNLLTIPKQVVYINFLLHSLLYYTIIQNPFLFYHIISQKYKYFSAVFEN